MSGGFGGITDLSVTSTALHANFGNVNIGSIKMRENIPENNDISIKLLMTLRNQSCSVPNFAVHLLGHFFSQDELANPNTTVTGKAVDKIRSSHKSRRSCIQIGRS